MAGGDKPAGRMLRPEAEVLPDDALVMEPAGGVTVRAARLADAEAIRTIYNAEVAGSTVTFDLVPRTLEDQRAWLREHDGAHPAIVAEVDGVVVGFGSISAYRPRPAYRRAWRTSFTCGKISAGTDRQAAPRGLAQPRVGPRVPRVFARIVGSHKA